MSGNGSLKYCQELKTYIDEFTKKKFKKKIIIIHFLIIIK